MYLAKEFKQMLKPFLDAGFRVEPTRNCHVRVLDVNGNPVAVVPSTPSDRRAVLNARAQLRRALNDR